MGKTTSKDSMTETPVPQVSSPAIERAFAALDAYHDPKYRRDALPQWAQHPEPSLEELGLGDDQELVEELVTLGWAQVISAFHYQRIVDQTSKPWG